MQVYRLQLYRELDVAGRTALKRGCHRTQPIHLVVDKHLLKDPVFRLFHRE